MNTLASKALRHPRAIAHSAGVLASIAVLAASGVLMFQAHTDRVAERHHAAIEVTKKIGAEALQLLSAANAAVNPDCSPESLLELNRLQVETTRLTDVGVLDEKGRLMCTTHSGVFPSALEVPKPDHVLSATHAGASVTHHVPLALYEGRSRSGVITLGRFNAVVHPQAVREILDSGVDALWARDEQGGFHLATGLSDVDAATKLQDSLDGLITNAEQSPTLTPEKTLGQVVPGSLAWHAVTPSPSGKYLVQSITPLPLLSGAPFASGAAFLLALCTGFLASAATRRAIRASTGRERRLRKLLTPENMICVYQPIVSLSSGLPVGFEVLTRLRDGADVIYPDQFIPDVVRFGLTWQMDRAVIERACLDLIHHDIPVYGTRIAFNLFPENIRATKIKSLFEQHARALKGRGALIDLEIIEQDYCDAMTADLAELRAAGFLISVDDFGTGYSNLGSVRKVNPDYIKIDRSFVQDIEEEGAPTCLVPEIVHIARAVRARVVAEGVEHEHQAAALQRMGVEYAQGYLFAKPMSAKDLGAYLSSDGSNVVPIKPRLRVITA